MSSPTKRRRSPDIYLSDSEASEQNGLGSSPLGSSTNVAANANKRRKVLEGLPRSTPPPLPLPLTMSEGSSRSSSATLRGGSGEMEMDMDMAEEVRGLRGVVMQREEVQQDQDEEEEEDEEEDEEAEDEATQAAFEVQVEKKKKAVKRKGIIAKAGIIEEVRLVDFMCHPFVKVRFGPQINFLVGNNGSGKSAVLTGITIALGGNAKATNRGANAAALIRDGATQATCAVRFKNQGPDAYRRAIYGDTITIERKIRKDGSSSYSIQNSEGKTVDTRKSIVNDVLDEFGIQVDNPMTVLTQDQSRSFLANSSSRDKYAFFLRGSLLATLTEDYDKIDSTCQVMHEALDRKDEIVRDVKARFQQARQRVKDASEATEMEEKLEGLKDELAWSAVDELEGKVAYGNGLLKDEEKVRNKIVVRVQEFQTKLAGLEGDKADILEALEEQTAARDREQATLDGLRRRLKDSNEEVKGLKNDERKTNSTIQRLQDNVASFDRQIAEEKDRLTRDVDAVRAPLHARIEEINRTKAELAHRLNQRLHSIEDVKTELKTLGESLRQVDDNLQAAFRRDQTLKDRRAELKKARTNPDAAFGSNVPKLIELIKQHAGSWRNEPVGPLGKFVEIRDSAYAKVVESVLGDVLNGFAVQSAEDKALLTRLCKLAAVNVPIYKVEYDGKFNCKAGEPEATQTTILRVLQINSEYVKQVLINSNRIESAALVNLRADGDVLMKSRPRNVASCYSADLYSLGGASGGASSTALTAYRGPSRLNANRDGEIAELEAEINHAAQATRELQLQNAQLKDDIARMTQRKSNYEEDVRKIQAEMTRMNTESAVLYEALRDEEPNESLTSLEDNKKEVEAELTSIKEQFEALKKQIADRMSQAAPFVAKKDATTVLLDAAMKMVQKLEEKRDKLISEKLQLESSQQQYDAKLKASDAKIAELNHTLLQLRNDLETSTAQASSIGDRPQNEVKRKATKIQMEIDALTKALKERDRRQGGSLAELKADLEKRKREFDEAREAVGSLRQLCRTLEDALETRKKRWDIFRRLIIGRVKLFFAMHLSVRGFQGKAKFDTRRDTLSLVVSPAGADTQTSTQTARAKDNNTLSGGEKSYSSICFLLAMWEGISGTLRCLDEFDVFMDAVNRRLAMNMLMEEALAADSTQYLIITPQAMGRETWPPEVRVIKLLDPVRGEQGRLNFAPHART